MYVRTYVCTICLCLCVSGETAMSEEMRRADFKEKQGILIRKVCLHTNWLLKGCDVLSVLVFMCSYPIAEPPTNSEGTARKDDPTVSCCTYI